MLIPPDITQKPHDQTAGQRDRNIEKNQVIISLDFDEWEGLIDSFGIKEPLIQNREDNQATDVGARGWYG